MKKDFSRKIRSQSRGAPQQSDERVSRRGVVTKLAIGTGLVAGSQAMPESWKKPVMRSVLLPAHAEPSCWIGSPPPSLSQSVRRCSPESSQTSGT